MILALLMSTAMAQDVDGDGWDVAQGDCNDFNGNIHPGADEICDGLDNDCCAGVDDNCDGLDNPVITYLWRDRDDDGFGTPGGIRVCPEDSEEDLVAMGLVHPDASEVCDGVDNDCNELVDDDPVDAITWYLDEDDDGLGDPDTTQESCDQPPGWVRNGDDANDTPAAPRARRGRAGGSAR